MSTRSLRRSTRSRSRKSQSTSDDDTDFENNSQEPQRVQKHPISAEPRPGTSAQAVREIKKEKEVYERNKKSGEAQKRSLTQNENDRSVNKRPKHNEQVSCSLQTNNSEKQHYGMEVRRMHASQPKVTSSKDCPPLSGIIKSIRFYNFMCHSAFYKEWHKNLNFVVGENGSGKSALLSGILIGLGCRALTTSRTKSISNLIQTGKDFAKTEITLLNVSGGISEEKYGKEFTIERVMSAKGNSTYKIRTVGRALRPLLRPELDYILLSLDIQLDNPLMILNQETARTFLNSKNPKDKYKLFYDGTMMSKIIELLTDAQVNVDYSSKNLTNFEENLRCVERQTVEYREKYKKIQEIEKIRETLDNIYAEYVWSKVIDAEKRKESKEILFHAANAELKKYESNLEATLKKKAELMAVDTDKEEEKQSRLTLRSKETEFQELRSNFSKIRSQLKDSRLKLQNFDKRIVMRRERMNECKSTIEEIQSKAKENEEILQAQYAEKKEKLDTAKAAVLQKINTLKQDADQFKCGADALMNEVHGLKDKSKDLKRRIEKTENSLTMLRKSTSNKYSVYGRKIEELIAKINANERKFKKKPIGPVGAYCTIKDPKWVDLVESILNPYTNAFVVDNGDDQLIFKGLMESVYANSGANEKRPVIFQTQFSSKAFDISNGEARVSGILNLMDVIEIEDNNHLIFNALCDMVSTERILLFEDRKQAIGLVGNPNKCPQTCQGGYSLDFYKVTPTPNYGVWANKVHQAVYLKTSSKGQAGALRNSLNLLMQELKEVTAVLEAKSSEESNLREEYNKRQLALSEARKKSHRLDTEIQSLTQQQSFQPDVDTQLEELSDLTKEYEDAVAEQETIKKLLESNEEKALKMEHRKSCLESEIKELTDLITKIAERTETRQNKLQKVENIISRMTAQVNKHKKEQEICQKAIDTIDVELQRKLKVAEEKAQRVETERSPSDLENEFQTMKKTIEESDKLLGSKNEIEIKLKEIQKHLNGLKTHYNDFSKAVKLVNAILEIQFFSFYKSRGETGTLVQAYFHAMARTRGYKGNLLIDHEVQELFYYVCPDDDANTATKAIIASENSKQTRQKLMDYALGLSGGERSYATICFIISMWKVMNCPFFMLDEFDVFMDPFNRKTSQNALLSHAKANGQNQFFFFTPLELTQIPTPEEGCVLRMFPPIRDETTRVGQVIPDSPNGSVGDVENDDPSGGRAGRPKTKGGSRGTVMGEKTNRSRR